MITKKLLLMGSMAVMGIAFTSCSHEALYDEGAVAQLKDATYAANFEKTFGKIDPNQTWDFSTGTTTVVSTSSSSTRTRIATAGEAKFVRDVTTLTVEKDICEWMLNNLPKGKNNVGKGRKFDMNVDYDLTIVPLFQGCASYYWELWMHVDGLGEERIWSKGEDLKYKKSEEDDWTSVDKGTDGMQRKDGPFIVNAPCYTYTKLIGGAATSFYLKVWKSHSDYEKHVENSLDTKYQPDIKSSVNSCMLDLQDAPKPKGLPAGYKATIIGCEDGVDNDYEDLVFMVYGNPTKRVEEVSKAKTKRYIMEDLGDADDFDFNDVVFDISYDRQDVTYYYDSENATEPYDSLVVDQPSEGVIRAAGGTLDFEIKIGNSMVWAKRNAASIKTTDMVNTGNNYDINYVLGTFDATGYDPATNNISVTVYKKTETVGSEGVYEIPFPEMGAAPKIVAVSVETKWMTERKRVPKEWFTSSSN